MTGTSYDDIEAVQEYRRRKLHEDSDLGENASLEELQAEYMRIQQQRWEYACLYHNYETYCFSRSVTVDQAKAVFFSIGENSEGENVAVAEIMGGRPDDRAGRTGEETVIRPDSVTMVTRETGKNSGRAVYYYNGLDGELYPHCARTAACNLYATAQTAGLDDPIAGGETACARTIHGGGDRKAVCDGRYSNTSGTKTLQELVMDGDVGPGSIISEYTGNSGSGYHALTIASINRDEQGNIVSYSVMDNNGGGSSGGRSRIRVIDINDTSGIAGKRVIYTNAGEWAMDQYEAQMEGKSEEDLRAMIEEAKRDTDTLIDSLAIQENILLNDRNYTLTCGGGQTRIIALERQRLNLNTFYNDQYVEVANEYLAIHPAEVEQEAVVDAELEAEVGGEPEVVVGGEPEAEVGGESEAEVGVEPEAKTLSIDEIFISVANETMKFKKRVDDMLKSTVSDEPTGEYTFEEKSDVSASMGEQLLKAEEEFNENVAKISAGTYGKGENVMRRSVAEHQVGTPSLEGGNLVQDEQTLEVEQDVEREKTPAELKKITKMQGWFSRVKIDPALVDSMVEKYGVDVAYDLALKSMTEPYNVSQGVGTNFMNSKKCINYFLDNEVSDEVIARVTGREVASSDHVKVGDKFTFVTGQGNTPVGMER